MHAQGIRIAILVVSQKLINFQQGEESGRGYCWILSRILDDIATRLASMLWITNIYNINTHNEFSLSPEQVLLGTTRSEEMLAVLSTTRTISKTALEKVNA